jgi:DnaJ-class molecular chaperone
MSDNTYWEDSLSEIFDGAGITFTPEQLKLVAIDVRTSADMEQEISGGSCASNPLEDENRQLKKALDEEKSKIRCNKCGGTGDCPIYGKRGTCSFCKGEGRVSL